MDETYRKLVIGPRRIGGIYRSGYWGTTYEVIDIADRWISERNLDGPYAGRVRDHFTAWDSKRDTVIRQP